MGRGFVRREEHSLCVIVVADSGELCAADVVGGRVVHDPPRDARGEHEEVDWDFCSGDDFGEAGCDLRDEVKVCFCHVELSVRVFGQVYHALGIIAG